MIRPTRMNINTAGWVLTIISVWVRTMGVHYITFYHGFLTWPK